MALSLASSRNSRGRRFRDTAREFIVRWRYRGHTGRLIRRHRALRSLDVQTSSFAHPLILTATTIAAIVLARDIVIVAWVETLDFWCKSIGIETTIRVRTMTLFDGFNYQSPVLRLETVLPNEQSLKYSLAAVVGALVASYLFTRRFLPLCYLVWALGFIQLLSIGFFYFRPGLFPYSTATHIAASLEAVLMLLFVVPLILMFAYYPLNFSLLKKIALTSYLLLMIGIFTPHLYACHIVILQNYSVLYMPLLFTMFGVLPIILMFVAIYAWGMSWSQRA